jgi:hypothetical protein
MGNMQAHQPHIGERQNHDVHPREQGAGRLDEALLRDLPILYKWAYRDVAQPQQISICCLDEPVNIMYPAHKGFH